MITTTTTIIADQTVYEKKPLGTSPPTRFQWESYPIPLIPTSHHQNGLRDQYTAAASEMALVHNCIIRALNSIYIQAPHVPIAEYANFVRYCIATFDGLTAHHHGEEEIFFPELERITGEKGLMDINIKQHEVFETGFAAWGAWLHSILSAQTTFSPSTCKELMDAFIPPLSQHLADEIPTILSLSRFGDKLDLVAMSKAEGEKVMGGMSKTRTLPIFLLNHDVGFEGGWHSFPPIPASVRWVLREVCGRWQGQWWKFSTVGFDGAPRELRFMGDRE